MSQENEELKERIKQLENEISNLKQKQIDVNRAKELYLKIFEEFPALIWRSRTDKLCDYFNKTWYEFTGRSYQQEYGNGWAEGVHPDDFDNCLEIYVNAFDKREAFLMEYRLRNKFGEYRWIRDFGRPFYDLDNTFLGYIGSCYDITEIKDNEKKLVELNATKDKFFSIIAHDLKNPFHQILLGIEMLMKNIEKQDTCKLPKLAKELYSIANNTYNLLENLLEWAGKQQERISFNPQDILFQDVLTETVNNLQSQILSKNIKIILPDNAAISIRADKNMLKTVLRNLLSNAIKYSYTNSQIKIDLTVKDHQLIFTISDNGIGISKEGMNQLFILSELHSTPGTANEKGTGLGLILCKEFIENHNGSIWIESEYGKGTNISFSLPIKHN